MNIKRRLLGRADGVDIYLITMRNRSGAEVTFTNYGCAIQSLKIPSPDRGLVDVVLGYDDLEEYINDNYFMGCIVGRYANRIGGASFKINNKTYHLPANEGKNHLHGGLRGFNKYPWRFSVLDNGKIAKVVFERVSLHLEEGYPGNLNITIEYSWSDDNTLGIAYHATTDMPTHVNLTNHAYFNLDGHNAGTIDDHLLEIRSDGVCAVDHEGIPTGELRKVENTGLDMNKGRLLGGHADGTEDDSGAALRLDHSFLLNAHRDQLVHAASLRSRSGRLAMHVHTDCPSMQVYTADHLPDGLDGKSGAVYHPRSGICLECQYLPNSPNVPQFPGTLLYPGEEYQSRTAYTFTSGKIKK